MSELSAPKLSKWPFLLGDALLLALAVFIACQRGFASGVVEVTLLVLCVAGAALLGITPYLLEYGALVKVVEAGALTSVTAQIKDLEALPPGSAAPPGAGRTRRTRQTRPRGRPGKLPTA